MKKVLVVIIALVLVTTLFACGTPQPTTSQTPASEAPATEAPASDAPASEAPAAEKPATDGKKIVIAATGLQQDQFTNVLMSGYKDKADELGIEILIANSQLSLDKESEMINNFLEAGVSALIIEPVSPDATVAMAELAQKKGIPVFACAIPINSDIIFASSINDNKDLGSKTGKAAAPFLEKNYGKDKEIKTALLAFDSADPEGSEARIASFQNEVKDYKMTYVARQDVDTDNAYQVVTDILTANPDLNIIYSACENGLVGAYNAVKAAGKAGEVFVFGVDASAQICEMMLSGSNIIQATTAQAPYEQGQYAVQTMYDYVVNGTEPAEKNRVLDGILVTMEDEAGIKSFKEMWESRAK